MRGLPRLLSRALLVGRRPQTRGRIESRGLDREVEVTRDAWGIPHIRARCQRDLFFAQGFVHAQDRLWQMETMRRLTSGRLSEVAGTATLLLDWHCRMLGMPDMKRRAFDALRDEERHLFDAYAAGVNACIERMGKQLPLELASLGVSLEPWSTADCISSLPYLSWVLMFAPYAEKLLALARGGSLTFAEWNDMFPSHPGAELPPDDWFDRAKGMRFGAIHPGAFAFHAGLVGERAPAQLGRVLLSLAVSGGASNNWVVARGADGLPLLANDPHLGVSLPATWYFCHLEVHGEVNAAGASLAGTPGLVIGRTEHAAWGLTNFMLDAVDILTYRVNPRDPLRYQAAGRELKMREVPLTFGLPKGKKVTVPLHLTEAGPVITLLEEGMDAAAVLKWYGTLPDEALTDRSFTGTFAFMRSRTVSELLDAARHWQYSAQNFVAADDAGHIGWHVTGAAPIRRGYTGRLPADASAGADWIGFHPYESLPRLDDPPEGWIATANYRPEIAGAWPTLSHVWFAPWRVQSISAALRRMGRPGLEDFQKLQMDVHSPQADLLVPKIAALGARSAAAREAVDILRAWDREVRADSAGAAVFEVVLTELTRGLLGHALGDDMALFFNARCYGPENEILDRPGSPLWQAVPAQVVDQALSKAMAFCASRMGPDRRRWSWGRLHRYVFHHPGARTRVLKWLLNPAPSTAHGDANTINVVTPAHAPGVVNVVVTNPMGGGSATLTNGYTYTP